jgi:hypothetical protein
MKDQVLKKSARWIKAFLFFKSPTQNKYMMSSVKKITILMGFLRKRLKKFIVYLKKIMGLYYLEKYQPPRSLSVEK